MQNTYNFYNLEASFKKYLLAENISLRTIKNYLSDLRYFLGWSHQYLEKTGLLANLRADLKNVDINVHLVSNLGSGLIMQYKTSMIEAVIPIQTVNRRLSSVRKFCQMAVVNKWLVTNPAAEIKSVNKNHTVATTDVLDTYVRFLLKSSLTNARINIIINDLKELIFI